MVLRCLPKEPEKKAESEVKEDWKAKYEGWSKEELQKESRRLAEEMQSYHKQGKRAPDELTREQRRVASLHLKQHYEEKRKGK